MDDLLKLETETFNKLYTDYRLRFIRFAQTYIPDISIAEDIVMDTLAYYWEHRRDIKNDENILSYLLTAIKHKCLNYLRQERFNSGDSIVVQNKEVEHYKYTGKFRQSRGVINALRLLQKDAPFTIEQDEDKQIIYIK